MPTSLIWYQSLSLGFRVGHVTDMVKESRLGQIPTSQIWYQSLFFGFMAGHVTDLVRKSRSGQLPTSLIWYQGLSSRFWVGHVTDLVPGTRARQLPSSVMYVCAYVSTHLCIGVGPRRNKCCKSTQKSYETRACEEVGGILWPKASSGKGEDLRRRPNLGKV